MESNRYVVIAMFDQVTGARTAEAELRKNGFDDVSLSEGVPTGVAGGQKAEKGFWTRVKEFFGAEDVGLYTEASRRGGTLLTVDVEDQSRLDLVVDILQRHGSVNIDERAAT